jgi:hypothetical protein
MFLPYPPISQAIKTDWAAALTIGLFHPFFNCETRLTDNPHLSKPLFLLLW